MAHPNAGDVKGRHERARGLLERTGHHMEKDADLREDKALIVRAIRSHEDSEHGGRHEKLKFKDGGAIDGEKAKHHLARRARGGSTPGKRGTHVNVIVAPQGGMHPPGMMPTAQPMTPPRPPMAPPPGAGQPMAPPARPAGPPPMPPGGAMRPPGMMKRGGGVQTTLEKGEPSESLLQAKHGGHVPQMEAGAGGAEGRIEKMHEYGEGGFKPKEHYKKLFKK